MAKNTNWRKKLHEIIYEADTFEGKLFDIILLILILISIALVMLESVKEIDAQYHNLLNALEWIITVLFTIEYLTRIISVNQPFKYIFSFYGIIDLLSIIPKYISFFVGGTHALVALRSLRLLRVFRILKLARYLGASESLLKALIASRVKISVFLFAVVILSIILGTIMYMVEGDAAGFNSIPKSVYWCVVTLTTVGFGDITPQTPLGQFIATIVMILGYGIIAVPTGIVSVEYSQQNKPTSPTPTVKINTQSCQNCGETNHADHAQFCHQCGAALH